MDNYEIFQEVSVGPGRAYKLKASSSKVLSIVQEAKELGIDISTPEKILWKILIFPFAFMFGGLIGFVLGLGILIPIVYYQALKWQEILGVLFFRWIIFVRFKGMVSRYKLG